MTYRTFHFDSIQAAGRFCENEQLPFAGIEVLKRNANGIATRCQISAPAALFGPVSA